MTRSSMTRAAASGIVALTLLLSGGAALAATVSGIVKNQANIGLPGVTVEWRNDSTGTVSTTTSNGSGNYSISIDPATYTVKLTEPASGTVSTVPGVTITGNTTRDFVLILADRLPPMRFYGRVLRDDTNGPARNLRMYVYDELKGQYLTQNLYTDDNGDYSFDYQPELGQPYGTWRIYAFTSYITDRGDLPAGNLIVRQSVPVTGDWHLDYMVHTVTARGTLTRCDEAGNPTTFPAEGTSIRMYMGNWYGTYAYADVNPADGSFEATLLQTNLNPGNVSRGNVWIQARALGYCAPFEDETTRTPDDLQVTIDAYGSSDVSDIDYTKCLPVVPLMKTRVVDIEGNPIGNVEIQVYNETLNKWVVQSGARYTERDRANTETYGRACFGVSEGVLRTYFNSRSFDSGSYGGEHFGGTWGKTPAGRWQVNGFTMPATGLDVGDQVIPTLYLRGQTNPPVANTTIYTYLNWSTSYGYNYATTDAEGRYDIAIIPTDKITLPYNPASLSTAWLIRKFPPFGTDCGGVPCVEDFELLPQSDTAGYLQGATSAKTSIDWTPGVPLTGEMKDWDGNPIPYAYMGFYRQEGGYNWWSYCREQAANSHGYDQDGDSFNGSRLCWMPPHEYRYVYTYMPSYGSFNPRSDAPHVPLNRSLTPWLQNYLISASGEVLPWDTRETAHAIYIRVLTSLGLGVPGTVVNFDSSYQMGQAFDNFGNVDMYPYGGQAGTPADPAVQFNVNAWVTVTPPAATNLPSFTLQESTTSAKTLTYIYPVVNANVPIILGVDIVARTEYSLTSQFVADQLVDGIMCCGLDAGTLDACTSTAELSETHTLEVDGLEPGQTYECQVCGANASGQDGCSELFTGTTLDACDELPPTQANFAYNISDTKINVTWTTNEACQGSVVVDGDPLSVVFEDKLGTSHGIIIDGLAPETEYVLSVSCTDTCGNTRTQTSAVTTLETQTDPDVTPPICSGVVSDLGETYVIFAISCNEPSRVNVQCADAVTHQIYIGQNNTAALTLPVSVTSLTADTSYTCAANGIDAFDNQAAFSLPDITTPAAVLPMIITAGPTVSASDVLASVVWQTGDADGNDRAGTTEIAFSVKTGAACSDPSTWSPADQVKNLSPVVNHSVDLNGLAPETTYCYQVRTVGLHSTAESAVLEFTTLAAPVILAIDAVDVTTLPAAACQDVLVSLTTSKPAEVILQVGAVLRPDGNLLNPITAYGRPAASEHTITVGGLTPGVDHYYTVLVYDQDGATVRYPASGLAQYTNCGGAPNEPPVVTSTGPNYNAECASHAGAAFTLSGTVRDPYGCTLAGCPGDEELECSWIDTITSEVVATAYSTGAVPGSPDEAQSCSVVATFPLGTSFVKLEAAEQAAGGLTGLSGTFQVIVRDTAVPCISAGPDVSWGAVASDCTIAGGAPGVLVNVLDLDGDGVDDIVDRPLAETGLCNDAPVWDTCDAAPTVSVVPAAYDVANYGPYVHCVGYGQTVTLTYQAVDSIGNKGTDTFTVSVADLCDGVDCTGLDDQCVIGVCNPASGTCETSPRPDLTGCSDGDGCTVSDVCRAGVCSGAPKCEGLNSASACRVGVCDPTTFACSTVRADTATCNHAPTAKCVSYTAALDASGNVTVLAASVAGTSTDVDSDALTLSIDPDSFTCADLGPNAVTASVSDFALTSTCAATVTITDATAPTVTCPDDVTADTAAGTCAATISYADPTTSDNCGGTSVALTSGLGSGASFGLGGHTESWTATDAGGNTASCSFDVTVSDAEAPSVTCAPDVSADNDAGVCGAAVTFSDATASDNCGAASVAHTGGPASGATFAVGTTSATFTATDAGGLTADCQVAVTVSDTELPTVTCPADVTASTDAGVCGATVSFADPITNDNCDGATFALTEGGASGSFFPAGTTAQTFVATDGVGLEASCGFSVTVTDGEGPTITCPADVTSGTDAGTCAAVVSYADPTASDNCSGATVSMTSGLGSGASFGLGAHTESWQATDAASNASSCDVQITVSDDEAPSVTCPADIATVTDAGACAAAVTFAAPTASDNCGAATTSQAAGLASGADFPVGTTTQGFDATDAAGNSASCGFAVSVTDAEPPTATCPADIAVGTDAGQCGAVVTFADPTGADNCGIASSSVTGGLASGALFPVGTTAQSLAVADAAGLTAGCGFDVTVSDTEDPTITCPANIVVGDGNGCTAFVSYPAPTFADNCAGATAALASGLGSDNVFPVGDTVETWTVTDAAGRTASCSFTVTVLNTDGDGDTVPCLDDSDDTNTNVCRDVDGDTCDDCSSGTDDTANDGVDLDGDGTCDDGDGCVADPNKTAPGVCGCNYPDTGDADGDGVLDCVDVCPGSDDAVDDDMNGIPDGCDNIAVLVDNDNANNTPGETEASQVGEWTNLGGPTGAYLDDYARSVAGTGADTATFTAYLPQNGQYAVYATWVDATRNATNAPYTITEYTGARTTVRVDQTVAPSGKFFAGHELQLLGTFEFKGGVASSVILSDDADGRVVADAIAFEFIGGITIEETKPELTVVRALDATTVEVTFAEPVDPNADVSKWEILDAGGNPLVIRGATVAGGTVTLTTDPHTFNLPYELTVREVYDLFGNLLLTDSWTYVLSSPTVIVDNATSTEPVLHAVCTDSSWASKTSDPGYYGNDHQLASNRRFRSGQCTYTPNLTIAGQYHVAARWTDGANRTARAAFRISDTSGTTTLAISQTSGGGMWNDLGIYDFAAGAGSVIIAKGTDNAFVDADAIRFAPVVDLGAGGPEQVATSADGAVTLTHNSALDMWIEPIATPAEGAVALATAVPALTVIGTAYDIGPSGTYPAGSPATMSLTYDDADLPPGTDESALEIYTLNGSVWEPLVTVSRDTVANVIVAEVPHQSVFALLAPAAKSVDGPVVATDVVALPDRRYDTFRPPETITVQFRLPEPWDVADVALPISADKTVDAVSVSSANGVASVAFDGADLLDLLSPNVTSRTHTIRGYLRPHGEASTLEFDRVPFEATVHFDTVTSLKKSKVHFHGSKPYARFEGSLLLTDGQIGADFRSGTTAGHGTVRVSLGDDDLVVYENTALTYEISGATQQNRDEKWRYDVHGTDDITFRWDTSPEYDAGNDPDLPRSVGELHSEFIRVAETKLELDFKRATLPLTVVIDGIVLLTVHQDGSVDSALPYEVHRKKVTVLFPDRLVPGNVVEWYRDGDTSDGVQDFVYGHECAADGTASATYTNGTARFDITVAIPTGLDADALAPRAVLAFSVGEPGVTLVNEALIDVDYRRHRDHGDADWKYSDRSDRHRDDDDDDDDDDDHDHGHCRGRD